MLSFRAYQLETVWRTKKRPGNSTEGTKTTGLYKNNSKYDNIAENRGEQDGACIMTRLHPTGMPKPCWERRKTILRSPWKLASPASVQVKLNVLIWHFHTLQRLKWLSTNDVFSRMSSTDVKLRIKVWKNWNPRPEQTTVQGEGKLRPSKVEDDSIPSPYLTSGARWRETTQVRQLTMKAFCQLVRRL